MKTREQLKRREVFKTTGWALGLFAMANGAPLAIADVGEGALRPVKRDPAQLQRLLDQLANSVSFELR